MGSALLGTGALSGCSEFITGEGFAFAAAPALLDQHEISSTERADEDVLDIRSPLRPTNATRVDLSRRIRRFGRSADLSLTNYATLYQAALDTSLGGPPVEGDDRFATVGEVLTLTTPAANVAGEDRNPAAELTPAAILEAVSGGGGEAAGGEENLFERVQLEAADATEVLQAGYRGDVAEIANVSGGATTFDGELAAGFEADVRLRDGTEYPIHAAVQRTEHEDTYVYLVMWFVDGDRAFGDRIDEWERTDWHPLTVATGSGDADRTITIEYYDTWCCNIYGETVDVCIKITYETAVLAPSDDSDEVLRSRMAEAQRRWDEGWERLPLSPRGAARSRRFAGLDHTPLGGATLDVADGVLAVSGIGDSGGGGVHVDTGESQGFVTWLPVRLDRMPVDAYRESRFEGVLDGDPGRSLGRLRLTRTSSGLSGWADFSGLGVETFSVTVADGDDVVAEASDLSDPVDIDPPRAEVLPECDCEYDWDDLEAEWTWKFGEAAAVALPDGTVRGDRIVFAPDGAVPAAGPVTGVDLVASGTEAFRIEDEAILRRDDANGVAVYHRALGSAALESRDGGSRLAVSDLGARDDGVRMDLADAVGAASIAARWRKLEDLPVGAAVEAEAHGTVGGTPNRLAASVRAAKTDAGVALEAGPRADESRPVEVRRGGEAVADLAEAANPVATAGAWPTGTGFGGPLAAAGDPLANERCVFDGTVDVRLADGRTVRGDEVRIGRPAGAPSQESLSSMRLRTEAVPSVTLTGETVVGRFPL